MQDQVFVSYSHKDKVWLDKLLTMLAPLVRTHAVSVWWDGEIEASQKWHVEIDRALDAAKVAVLLVSPHFLASDFINKNELPYLLDAAEQRSVKLIWVLVRNCLYDQTRIVDFQAAYDVSKPLNSLSEPELDAALVEICRVIGAAVSKVMHGEQEDDEGRSLKRDNAVERQIQEAKSQRSGWFEKNLGIGIVTLFTIFGVIVLIQMFLSSSDAGSSSLQIFNSLVIIFACLGFDTLGLFLHIRHKDILERSAA